MRRAEQTLPTIRAVEEALREINAGGVLRPGVHITTIYDRRELAELTTHHVVHNIIPGVCLVVFIRWLSLGDLRGALAVGGTMVLPFIVLVVLPVIVDLFGRGGLRGWWRRSEGGRDVKGLHNAPVG